MADETTVEVTKKITKKTKKKKVTIQEDFNTEERSGSIDQGSSEQPAENHTLTIEEITDQPPEKVEEVIVAKCGQCDLKLSGERYVSTKDGRHLCLKCFESQICSTCVECTRPIGIGAKDVVYKDRHWHEACFFCSKCANPLTDKSFGAKADKIFCMDCFDNQFSERCEGCKEIFRGGAPRIEYRGNAWHEQCYKCAKCNSVIGGGDFIPKGNDFLCNNCFDQDFSTKCTVCAQTIGADGLTYKNEPFHFDCFICIKCSVKLTGQKFTIQDNQRFCINCYNEMCAKKCDACTKPILAWNTNYVNFEDRNWHSDCFVCPGCQTTLVGKSFLPEQGLVCEGCLSKQRSV